MACGGPYQNQLSVLADALADMCLQVATRKAANVIYVVTGRMPTLLTV